jgi:radical SAM protein with 4Fe4S-binding SPASM domain
MVKYAKDSGGTDFVEFTTNGWWLNPGLNNELIESGLDAITISVPGVNANKIKNVCGRDIDFKKYVDNVCHFYNHKKQCRVHCKITNYDLSLPDRWTFYRLFQNCCDEISVDNIVPIWPGADGTMIRNRDKNIYGRDIRPVKVCPYIFYHLTINSNGQISTCFVDYAHKNIIGDVNTESVFDVWNGDRLKQIRINQLSGEPKGICVGCPQLKYGQADSIDECAKKILENLK